MKKKKKKLFTKNFVLFIFFTFTAILSHPFAIIILASVIVFIIIDYFFFLNNNRKINISLVLTSVLTIVFLYHYANYVSLDKIGWIEQPGIKFFTNFYFSNFFGSRLLGIVHLLALVILVYYFRKKIGKNKKIILLFILLFLTYFIPLIYGYLIKPIIFPKYIIFVLIPIILITSILVFLIENENVKRLVISFLILVNLANHFTESTLKQFFGERQRFNPNFEKAYEIIDKSETKRLNFYTNKINDENENYINTVLTNYSKKILTKKNYNIEVLKEVSENYGGKIWNICLNYEHKSVWDENWLTYNLKKSNFKKIICTEYKVSLNEKLLLDKKGREIESIYIEAIK